MSERHLVHDARDNPTQDSGRPPAQPPLVAHVHLEGRFLFAIPLLAQRTLVGRDADAAIRLKDTDVSRQHAVLMREDGNRFMLADLQSKNGTFLNEMPLSKPVLVRDGDVIRIANFSIHLQAEGRSPALTSGAHSPLSTDDPVNLTMEQGEARLSSAHIALLSQLGDTLLATPVPMDRMSAFCRLMTHELFRAHAAVVLGVLKDRPADPPRLLCPVQTTAQGRDNPLYLSRRVLEAIASSGRPVLATNAGKHADAVELSIAPSTIAVTVVACPVGSVGNDLSILYLILPPECASANWLALAALAAKQFEQADAAWDARALAESRAAVESELGQARQLQVRLVPRETRIAGLEYAIGFHPCRAVGGDYADVVGLPDGNILAIVADVCGKGLPAALIAFSIHTLVHSSSRRGSSLAELTEALNSYLCEVLPEGRFVTLIAAIIDPRTGGVEFMNAGHPSGLIVRPDGAARELASGENPPLGLFRVPFSTSPEALAGDELLVLFSDGLTELWTSPKNMLGSSDLAQRISTLYSAGPDIPAAILATALDAMLDQLQGNVPPQDDRTFLLARRRPM